NFKHFVEEYPNYGYGGSFYNWAMSDSKEPYNSWGNGSAMRVSSVGWIANSIEEVKKLSKAVSEVTHNHPEGIKGAEAIAMCIYMARLGKTKEEIKEYIYDNYYPELDYLDYEELLDTYEFDVSCQGSVPQAIFCFLIGEAFNDVIKTAVSIGGDSDTIACMAGSIAEAYYKDKQDITPTIKKFNENIEFPKEFVDITNSFLKLVKNNSYKLEYNSMAGKKVYR
ncbi:MAG: ADP-ribosylglycohydrolase family protein, partial [Erysipelotrichaceae bacterium]|nr:ADP-ribosylglycohydrolase family protein [Erysipelotrichaceae bacterium]